MSCILSKYIMNAQMYCNILAKKMILSLKALGRGAVFQHDNDPKHSAEATFAFLKKKRVKVLDWPSMSPDLNPIKHVWYHPKRQVEMRQPSNLHELKDVVATEWRHLNRYTTPDLKTLFLKGKK